MKTHTMKILFLCLSIFFATEYLSAENNDYSYWTLGIDKGLSHFNVTSIYSDSKGLLWVGTVVGLNCYDGYQVKNYLHKQEEPFSIPGDHIYHISEDKNGNLWISTNNGLVRYDRAKDIFIPPYSNQRVDATVSLCLDDRILFGGNKLYQYTCKDNLFKEIPSKAITKPYMQIRGIYELREDVLLLVTNNAGIWEYHEKSGEYRSSIYHNPSFSVTVSFLDSQQNLYLSDYGEGLFVFDNKGNQRKRFTTSNSELTYNIILDIEEKDGELWLATDGGGVNIMNISCLDEITSLQHIPGDKNSIPTNAITCLHKDSHGNIWAGSVREGVIEIRNSPIRIYKDVALGNKYGLSNKTIICLCQDKDKYIWIGTDGGGVNRYNPDDETFIHFPSTYNEKVISIVEYSPTELLISLYNNGVFRFNKITGKCIPFIIVDQETNAEQCKSSYLQLINKISDDKFLFLSMTPYIYDKTTSQFTALTIKGDPSLLSSLQLISIDLDKEEAYFVQKNHLMKADLKTNLVSMFYTIDQEEKVEVVSRDYDGIFWIGTNRGLRRYDSKKNEYSLISTNLFERVSAIQIEDDNNIWIGARNTLFSYNIKEKKFVIWGESEDYSSNELSNIYQPPSYGNYIYLGGVYGMVRINTSIQPHNDSEKVIQLADIVLDGVSLWNQNGASDIRSDIRIPWNYKSLQIKVRVVDKDVFRKELFKYTVTHNDESQDIESYNTIFPLSMLLPGKYTVQVSNYTQNGTWSAPYAILNVTVTPPWYKDYRVIIAVLLLLTGFVYWRVRSIIRRKEEKIKQKMNQVIQQTNQDKIQFLVNISHELRTPLTLIYSPIRKMLEKVDGDRIEKEDHDYMKRQLIQVHKSASQMKTIIDMTLDLNKISDEQNILHKKPHVLNEWICSVAEDFRYEFEDNFIELLYHLDGTVNMVVFDDVKCATVLSNLLMNALKFSPEHSQIIISSSLQEYTVRVSVTDQGIGLGKQDLSRLFARFYQGEHYKQGNGIGLSYSKTIVKKHGGTIGAFNNSDRGATFYFELPLQSSAEIFGNDEDMEHYASLKSSLFTSDPTADGANFTTQHYSVVIAEDNSELRNFLSDSLKENFKTVYSAQDGEAAWRFIKERMPDIIVSDIMMPLCNGYELCRRVKSNPVTSHIPVILLTALGDNQSTHMGYKLGADAYIPKPFETDFLQTILRNQLRNRELIKQQYRDTYIRVTGEVPSQMVNSDELFLLKFNKIILDNLVSGELNVKFLTEQMGMSRTPLYAKLKALTNLGVNDYINRLRVEKGAELLLNSSLSINEISENIGFEYPRYFSTLFKQLKGVTPTQFRQQNTHKRHEKDESGVGKDN